MSIRWRFTICATLAGLLALGLGYCFEGGAAPAEGSGLPDLEAPEEMAVTVQRTVGKSRLAHDLVGQRIGLRDLAEQFRTFDAGSAALARAFRCEFPGVPEERRSLCGSVRYLVNYLEDYESDRLTGLGTPLLAELMGMVCAKHERPLPTAEAVSL